MAGMPTRGQDGPLEVGYLSGGDFKNQQIMGMTVGNPATGQGYGGPVYSHWGGESDAHIAEMQRQHNAYLRSQDAKGFVRAPAAQPMMPETIAARAGFPLAGAAPATAINARPVAAPVQPIISTSPAQMVSNVGMVLSHAKAALDTALPPPSSHIQTSTGQPFPGALPWIQNLVASNFPGRSAVAAPAGAPVAPSSNLARINATPAASAPAAQPLAPWYQRLGLTPAPAAPARQDGVRG